MIPSVTSSNGTIVALNSHPTTTTAAAAAAAATTTTASMVIVQQQQHANHHPMKMKTFPWKLHEMLELADQEGYETIVSWLPDGRSFKVYHPKEFVAKIMPNFFLQSKYKSFQRQCK